MVRIGVPGTDDVLPQGANIVVETFHVGPGAKLVFGRDVTVQARTFLIEPAGRVVLFRSSSPLLLVEEATRGAGVSGAAFDLIAEDVVIEGDVDASGTEGAFPSGDGGDAGRVTITASTIDIGFSAHIAVNGGDGGAGQASLPCP